MGLGLDERETVIEGMILINLRTEMDSKEIDQDAVSFVAGTWIIHHTMLLALIAARHNVYDRRSLHITI